MTTEVAQPKASESFARALFVRGTDCLGAPEVKQVLGLECDKVPLIPFTEVELARARQLGQVLVLYVPTTMESIYSSLRNKLGDRGKLLCNIDWFEQEEFFLSPICAKPEWKLVTREVIPNSTGANCLAQTEAIIHYLVNEVYEGQVVPPSYQAAVDEFEKEKDCLAKLMDKDWQAAAKELPALQVNKLFRETPGEVIYRIALYEGVNNQRLLEGVYTWTNRLSSFDYLVGVGFAGADGANVGVYGPRFSGGSLGVCFSRSGLAES